MRLSIASITLVACILGAILTGVLFALAASAPNNDPVLEELVNDPGGWVWATTPYAALAAVAAGFRKRRAVSILVLCATVPTILFGIVDTYEYLRPLPPNTNEFARGLGYGTPLVLYLVAASLVIAIKCVDGLRWLINPSPCKR